MSSQFPYQIARLDDGSRVILSKDGTWRMEELAKDFSPVLASQATVQQAPAAFRKVSWGATTSEVKRAESATLDQEGDDLLVYRGRLAELDCLIAYIFVSDQLVRAKYIITEEHADDNSYISDYEKLKSIYIEKYGRPKESEEIWTNDLYQDDYQERGMAVSMGHLSIYSGWNTPDTDFGIYLNGDNYEVSLSIEYASRSLKAVEERAVKSRVFEDI